MNKKLVWNLIGSGMIGVGLGAAVTLSILTKKINEMTDYSEIIEEVNKLIDLAKGSEVVAD